ncbi:hypothetical protein ACHQM5_001270 [Ranunculus cassubicifolius]
MASSSSSSSFLILALALALATSMVVSAQNVPDCAANLIPCASYLNSTKPPESCCKPLRDTVATQRDCLCNLYSNPGLIQSFGINMTQALGLPKYCGVSADLTLCNKVSAPAPSTTTVPRVPPAVPGRDNNGAGKMAWSGASALLFFWVSIVTY